MPEWIPGAGKAFEMLCNILYGYIASYLFYVINIFLPELNSKQKCHHDVATCLAKILFNFKELEKSFGLPISQKQHKNFQRELTAIILKDQINSFQIYQPTIRYRQDNPRKAITATIAGVAALLQEALTLSDRLIGQQKIIFQRILLTIQSPYLSTNELDIFQFSSTYPPDELAKDLAQLHYRITTEITPQNIPANICNQVEEILPQLYIEQEEEIKKEATRKKDDAYSPIAPMKSVRITDLPPETREQIEQQFNVPQDSRF